MASLFGFVLFRKYCAASVWGMPNKTLQHVPPGAMSIYTITVLFTCKFKDDVALRRVWLPKLKMSFICICTSCSSFVRSKIICQGDQNFVQSVSALSLTGIFFFPQKLPSSSWGSFSSFVNVNDLILFSVKCSWQIILKLDTFTLKQELY